MKIYKDSELLDEITELDFGIVTAGESKNFTFYVFNETRAELENIKFMVMNKEVLVISAPSRLIAKSSEKLVLKWEPSITLREGLKALLKIEASELWG